MRDLNRGNLYWKYQKPLVELQVLSELFKIPFIVAYFDGVKNKGEE